MSKIALILTFKGISCFSCLDNISIEYISLCVHVFQKDFPEDGHDAKLKLCIFVNYMTLYPFFPVHYICVHNNIHNVFLKTFVYLFSSKKEHVLTKMSNSRDLIRINQMP